MSNTEKQWARPITAAEYFDVSTMTLYRWRKQSGFPQFIRRGRTVLYDIKAVEKWLAGKAHSRLRGV